MRISRVVMAPGGMPVLLSTLGEAADVLDQVRDAVTAFYDPVGRASRMSLTCGPETDIVSNASST